MIAGLSCFDCYIFCYKLFQIMAITDVICCWNDFLTGSCRTSFKCLKETAIICVVRLCNERENLLLHLAACITESAKSIRPIEKDH